MDSAKLLKEISFKAVRSSGPGGQHVNKTASKAVISLLLVPPRFLALKKNCAY